MRGCLDGAFRYRGQSTENGFGIKGIPAFSGDDSRKLTIIAQQTNHPLKEIRVGKTLGMSGGGTLIVRTGKGKHKERGIADNGIEDVIRIVL